MSRSADTNAGLAADLEALRRTVAAIDERLANLAQTLDTDGALAPLRPTADEHEPTLPERSASASSSGIRRKRPQSRAAWLRAMVVRYTSIAYWRALVVKAGWKMVWHQVLDVIKFIYLWRIRRWLTAVALWATLRSASWSSGDVVKGANRAAATWRRALGRVAHASIRGVASVVAPTAEY
ncbi:hypothetical protein BC828DRAFT_408766 [Blastocladiella britannica]|nr:hypothetical protein BC828DRAFT_408766 [Blastocladiella britannica]